VAIKITFLIEFKAIGILGLMVKIFIALFPNKVDQYSLIFKNQKTQESLI